MPHPQHRDMLTRLDAVKEAVQMLLSGRSEHPPEMTSAKSAEAAVDAAETLWALLGEKAKASVSL